MAAASETIRSRVVAQVKGENERDEAGCRRLHDRQRQARRGICYQAWAHTFCAVVRHLNPAFRHPEILAVVHDGRRSDGRAREGDEGIVPA